jgi:hypothetical protein
VACFGWPNLLSVVFGSISIVFLVFLVFTSTLASVDYEPVENDLDAVSSPAYRLFYNAALIFMTIDEYFIAYVIPAPWGHWWEALFNLVLASASFVIVTYFLPYQVLFLFYNQNSFNWEMSCVVGCVVYLSGQQLAPL